jgi:fibronectin-binding autotransporter adhesin
MSHIDMTAIRHALAERKTLGLRAFLGTVSVAALLAASPVLAADYIATDNNSLRTDIGTANGDGDPSSTITLGNDVTMVNGVLPAATKDITIDSGSFTFLKTYNSGNTSLGVLQIGTGTGTVTLKGRITGVNGGGNSIGQGGLYLPIGSAINYATITGGDGSGTGGGGFGFATLGAANFTNNGIITAGNATGTNGGNGGLLQRGATVINNGTVQGGNGTGGGIGIAATTGGGSNVTNNGTIKGGNGSAGAGGAGATVGTGGVLTNNSGATISGGNGTTLGGAGVSASAGIDVIVNSGTITGGNGAAAIVTSATGAGSAITNSGTLNAGAGYSDAIHENSPSASASLNLILEQGSVINGNVVGNTVATNALTLGGDSNVSFDASTIGPQYQNFTVFNKTGNSTWTLTGAASVATPWTVSAGTLQLGDGTATGSILGDLTDNATLAFNRSDSVTFANVISGTGAVVQAGSGTTILTGANSYSGGTSLNAGTLSVAGDGNLGDPAGALNFNGGTLQVTGTGFTGTARAITWGAAGGGFDIADAGNVFTVGQTLSGGALTKLGAGTLALTGSDTVAGTTISAGTLQIGAGGTAGSIAGNVTDNGVLAFNRSDAISFGGVISGTGVVSQIGGGNTTLTGANSYGGGTLISGGTLTGSATSFGSGAITDNAMLAINQPTDATFANAINGTGSFTKAGAGRFNYTGTGTLSGPTTVTAGLLSVNGSLASSAVTVASGASLGGNGTVGATTIQNGATIAPGNSIGTLHVNGAFMQAAGSTYQVELDPNSTAADLIQVNGAALLQGGAGLNVTKYVPGDYRLGTVYKVLSATNGVTGSYSLNGQTAGVSAFLALKDSYDPNNAYLTVIQTQSLSSVATTPNQQQVATAVTALPASDPVQTAVLNLPDAPSARAAFDQLAGQAATSAQGALLANGLYVRDAAFDRLRDVMCTPSQVSAQHNCGGKQLSIWEQGFGGWGGIAGNGNAAGLDHSTAGVLIGVDVPVEEWRLGVFGGYSHSDFAVTSGGAVGESNDYHLGLYGGRMIDQFALRLGASYSFDGITTDRAVAIGSFADNLRGLYNGGTTQAFGELGYDADAGGVTLEPFANLTYVGLTTSAFTEAGGAAALTVRANTTENMIATLGVRPSVDVDLGGLVGTLRGMAGWRHTFGTVTPDAQVSFAGGNVFGVSGAPIGSDAAAVEAGLDVSLDEGISFGLTYGGQFSDRTTDQTARGTIRVSF